MNAIYTDKKHKDVEAQKLLDSIDNYLLMELGIELPEPEENTIHNRIFYRKLSNVSGGRFDCNFYKSTYTNILNNIKRNSYDKLGHIVEFSSETWDQKSYFNITFPYIEIGHIDTLLGELREINKVALEEAPSRAKKIVRGGDILVSTTRPNRGAIIKIEPGNEIFIASSGFAVLRKIIKENTNKMYLFYVLRQLISLKQMEQRSSGGNYPAITEEELLNILIPLPSLEKQTEIADNITVIRNQAKEIKLEAKTDLEKAKKEVEAMILGEY